MKHRKLMSIILSILLLVAVIPLGTFTVNAAISGTCGDNVTWEYDTETATLTISGSGAMSDYSVSLYNGSIVTTAPWKSYYNTMKTVVINSGVTSIDDYAFYGCAGLTSITIPDSVTTIEDWAFYGCEGLSSITIPNSVTSIGRSAFRDCTGLTSITIPDSVTSIGTYAFDGCTGLESITVESGNSVYHSAGNCIIETDSKTLIAGCKNSIMPNDGSVTSIGNYAFYGCAGLTSITIPDSVTTIEDWAFYGCEGLSSITIPNSVTSIGNSAFYKCTGLTSITIPDSVTSIGRSAFRDCTGLTSITIPDSVTSIGDYAFEGCKGLTSVTIGNSVTEIGYEAFYECTGLTSITIPDSVTSIGNSAFYNTAWYNNQPNGLVYAGKVAYEYKGTCPANVTIKDGTLGVANRAFYGCEGLSSITIPNSVTSIGNSAFDGCTGLTSITIPDSVTSIGTYAFYKCTGLESITVESGNSVYHSAGNCIIETDSKTLIAGCKNSIMPNDGSVTSIGRYAFYKCTGLTSINIPDSVTSIGSSAFYECTGLTSVIYCGTEQQWNNILIGSDNTYLTSASISYHSCKEWYTRSAPTCTETGVEYATCSICGKETTRTVNALDHSFTNYMSNNDATCTQDGTKTAKCDRCDETDTVTDTGSKLGHNYVNTVGDEYLKSDADCTHAAVYYKSCSRCSKKSSETFEYGDPLGHDYLPVITPPTCTAQGYTTHTCSHCSDNYTDSYVYMPCGENCGFIIEGNKLYIYGAGDTNNYKTQGSVPWYDYADSITEIQIDEGITKIGNYAFYCLSNLKSIKSKNNNLEFGKYAINNSNTDITVLAENGGNIETYCTENSINYIDPTMAPEPQTVTANSITVKAVAGYEYSKDGTVWQNSNTFTGLSPVSEYSIYARYAATADIFNTLGTPLIVNTLKLTVLAPSKPVCIRNTDTEITLQANNLYEYSIDGENWQKSNVFSGLTHRETYSLYQRFAETETEYASEPSAPLVMQLVKKTVSAPAAPDYQSHTDNSITLAPNELYEYSIDGENWQKSSEFTGLSRNKIYRFYQRVAETETEYASEPSAAIIIAIPDKPIILEAGYENIILKYVDGFEYCLDDMVWQSSNAFDRLIDNTEYYVYQRLKAIDGEKVYQITSDYTAVTTDNSIIHTHTLGEWLYDNESHWNICDDCGYEQSRAEHVPSDWITDVKPTIENAGHKHIECTVCEYILAQEDIPQLPAYIPGDINGDGEINNKDLIRLFRYLSNWDVEVNPDALDINGDGTVNNKDLTRLFQYLSDWDVEIF